MKHDENKNNLNYYYMKTKKKYLNKCWYYVLVWEEHV